MLFVSNHKDCPQYRMLSQTNLHICILVFVKKFGENIFCFVTYIFTRIQLEFVFL